ncbi:MAG: MFS transporter [Acidimicrobiales bacterium]
MKRRRSLIPYLGGLIGPFGTGVVIPMLPELRTEFGVGTEAAALSYSLYFFPFAALLVISGTLGERFGRHRALQLAFGVYGLASLACAAAPTLTVMLGGRLFQGAANAFITPLLLAGLVEQENEDDFGKVVGTYGAFQALGGLLAPLFGGIAADINWRYAFFAVGIVSLGMIMAAPEGEASSAADRPSFASLATRSMGFLGVGSFLMAFGPIGAGVIVGLKLRDELELAGNQTGYVFVAGSAAAMVISPVAGRLIDSIGVRRVAVGAGLGVSAAVLWLAWIHQTAAATVAWIVVASLAITIAVVFQGLSAKAVPGNRGGAISATLSFRFLGHGLGPVAWTPLMASHSSWAFIGSAALGLPAIGFLLLAAHTAPDRSNA